MKWNYRPVQLGKMVGVFGVYYDESGQPISADCHPFVAQGPSRDELISQLELVLRELKENDTISLPFADEMELFDTRKR